MRCNKGKKVIGANVEGEWSGFQPASRILPIPLSFLDEVSYFSKWKMKLVSDHCCIYHLTIFPVVLSWSDGRLARWAIKWLLCITGVTLSVALQHADVIFASVLINPFSSEDSNPSSKTSQLVHFLYWPCFSWQFLFAWSEISIWGSRLALRVDVT